MKIRILNAVDTETFPSSTQEDQTFNDILGTEYIFRKRITSDRSGGSAYETELKDDELVEITLSDGSIWFLGVEELEELGSEDSRAQGDNVLDISESLFATQRARGGTTQGIRSVSGLAISLPGPIELLKKVKEFAQEQGTTIVVDAMSYYLARRIEKKNDTDGESLLCTLTIADHKAKLSPKILPSLDTHGKQAILILLHGTLSSTQGSFGALWDEGSIQFDRLRSTYGNRIYGFEHCTLTESPIENALTLIESLPENAVVHLLSHSRGGLVGELLCRGTRPGEDPISQDEKALFEEEVKAAASGNVVAEKLSDYKRQEIQFLQELNDALIRKSVNIERFVRVACPARGTTLASEKLGRWGNRVFNAIGQIPILQANPIYMAFKTFTLGVLKANTKAVVLPGLQAQMPGSALIHMLNGAGAPLNADLSVVAGDIDIKGRWDWKRLPIWATDQFYGGDHDLVVNTASMDGGSTRVDDIKVLPVRGEQVNHFSYFSNPESAVQIVNRLTGVNDAFITKPMPRDIVITRGEVRDRMSEVSGGKPRLILVPGILGSTLESRGDLIWANMFRIGLGGLGRISIDRNGVTAGNILSLAYGDFITEFQSDHDVDICPYDWRLSLETSADQLAAMLRREFARQKSQNDQQSIRIVAHSMGGLVARTMIAKYPDLWRQMTERADSRLIMAGTPSRGSYSITRCFMGDMPLIKMLALADLKNSKSDILKIISAYPGMAVMLPDFGEMDWLDIDVWQSVSKTVGKQEWSSPTKELLATAQRERNLLEASIVDPQHMLYVAGVSAATPCNATLEDRKLRIDYTKAGDGQVTWNEGIPSGLTRVWFQDSVHGALLASKANFDAWRELLHSGDTSLLKTTAPHRGTRGELRVLDVEATADEVLDFLPDDQTLIRVALGISTKHSSLPAAAIPDLHVSVAHGDLAFADYPVGVGHYLHDSITHAEKALDRSLQQRLSLRHATGQYPGEAGTSETIFFQSKSAITEGALIVGLGEFGELSAAKLERTLTQAIIRYIIEYNEWQARDGEQDLPAPVGLALLMIGSGIGSLSVQDSISAIIKSVIAANSSVSKLESAKLVQPLSRLQIIELYEDVAHSATHALYRFANSSGLNFTTNRELQFRNGGLQRSHFDASKDWWRTISVQQKKGGTLSFNDYTRYARNEISEQPIDTVFIDHYLSQVIDTTDYHANQRSSPSRTLFELLLPRSIKETSPNTDKLRLVLDKHTARFPWEMLIDGWSDKPTPLAVSKQVFRQLSTKEFRGLPQSAIGAQALVVGDPPGDTELYSRLPGARREARRVAKALKSNAYSVTQLIGEELIKENDRELGFRIVDELMSQEYSILHFAAHGSYTREASLDPNKPQEHGMVIGPGLWLTPKLISNMRKVPTLVFLNCCHLGLIEQGAHEQSPSYNQIAANLATEFIQMGSKAVVAAGWAVSDAAAELFADVFYAKILSDESFAAAAAAAREITFRTYPDTNTFGAYQCWGDPEFKLKPLAGSGKSKKGDDQYFSVQEIIIAANNLRQQALTVSKSSALYLKTNIDELKNYIYTNYGDPSNESTQMSKQQTQALSALGRTYGEYGDLQAAITILRSAIRINAAAITGEDYQQLGNFECRHGVDLKLKGTTDEQQHAAAYLSEGVERIRNIIHHSTLLADSNNHREIHGILGSSYKRSAIILDGQDMQGINTALDEMFKNYAVAWLGENPTASAINIKSIAEKAHRKNKNPDNYAFVNFALAAVVKAWYPSGGQVSKFPTLLVDAMRQLTNEHRLRDDRAEDFWTEIAYADIILVQLLHTNLRRSVGIFSDDDDLIDAMQRTYARVKNRFGSCRQWSSAIDQLRFVNEMLSKKPKQSEYQLQLIGQLNDLESEIVKYKDFS